MMNKILLPIILFFCFTPTLVQASHLYGGELTYSYNGTGYTVEVALYRNCAQASMPNNISLDVYSVSKNYSYSKAIYLQNNENISPDCAASNACFSTSATTPGYEVYYYRDTLILPDTASDWVISTTINSRTTLDNMGSGDLYLDAWLNNTTGENDIAYTPPYPPMLLSTDSTVIPLQTLDPEGDSLAIDTVAPRYSTLAAALYYSGNGYGPNTPLGANGIYRIDNSSQTMVIKGNNIGKYAVAYRVKEYRNGVMVGAHLRDFVTTIVGGNTITYPMLTSTPTTIYTCPGSTTDTARFTVTDPTSGDSVYLSFVVPSPSGFNYQFGLTNGRPTASGYCTWSTPSSLNLNDLPYFYVTAYVRDNSCPSAYTRYAVLVKTRQCNPDSVWPGDANNDKVVNLLDPLAVALTYGETGIVRANATNNWVGQAAIDWGTNIPNSNYDKKYADCDGNGTVNNNDLIPINTHWGQTHPKDAPRNKTTAAADLYFDLNGIVFQPGMAVTVPINLGTTANPITDFYGLGVRVGVEVAGAPPLTQATITYPVSWLGSSANTVRFTKDIANGTIDWVYARNDHQNASGGGTIAMLKFDIPATAKHGDTIFFTYRIPTMISADGKTIAGYNTIDDTAYIENVNVQGLQSAILNTAIIPNPSSGSAVVSLSLYKAQAIQLSVTDITGKQLWSVAKEMSKGTQQVALPASELPSGVYMVRITNNDGVPLILKWVVR